MGTKIKKTLHRKGYRSTTVLASQPIVSKAIWQIQNLIETWLPHLEHNNRSYVTIAIGCTGGLHRSVYIAETLSGYFSMSHLSVQTRHNELKTDNLCKNRMQRTLTVINKLGLHARAATQLVKLTSRFSAEISIENEGKRVSASSVLGIMMLEASQNKDVLVSCNGEDVEQAIEAVSKLFSARFNEAE